MLHFNATATYARRHLASQSTTAVKPDYGSFSGFDHCHWWVGNAKQAAAWFSARFGFQRVAYRGLETGSRDVVTHVVRQGRIVFAFSSALMPKGAPSAGDDISRHIAVHGDGVKDVAFTVSDCRKIYASAIARGAVSIQEPAEMTDEHGTAITATIKTYGDMLHTFVQRSEYKGPFLPGFKDVVDTDPLVRVTAPVGLDFIDHVRAPRFTLGMEWIRSQCRSPRFQIVGNQPDHGMMPIVEWYERVLQFHRFWSVDDSQIHTEFSSLRSVVMADFTGWWTPSFKVSRTNAHASGCTSRAESIKMPINEPAPGLRKSQIAEYVDYYGGPGVQHIALNTRNILHAVEALKARGVEFLTVPEHYYDSLRARLAGCATVKVKEDIAAIQVSGGNGDLPCRGVLTVWCFSSQKLNILVDFDDKGYLLQLFTAPLQDRPTVVRS